MIFLYTLNNKGQQFTNLRCYTVCERKPLLIYKYWYKHIQFYTTNNYVYCQQLSYRLNFISFRVPVISHLID